MKQNQKTGFRCLTILLGMSIFFAAIVCFASDEISRPQLVAIPHPNLTGLEQAVVDQLKTGQRNVEDIADNPEATDKMKALVFGELGHLYHTYDFLDAAAAAYFNASQLQNDVFRWSYCVAFVAQKQGGYEKALVYYKKARSTEVTTDLMYLVNIRIGECYQDINDLENAGYAYSVAKTLIPQGPTVQARLGELYLAKKEYNKAVNHLTFALNLQPDANKLHYPLAMAYRKLGEKDLAMQHLAARGIVGIQPPDPLRNKLDSLLRGYRVHILEGKMAFGAERYEEAAASFTKAAGEDPSKSSAWVNLAATHSKLDKPKEALGNLEHALKLDPEDLTAHYNIGDLYLSLGQYSKSIEHLKKYISTNSEDAVAYAKIASAYRQSIQFQESLEMYKKSLRLDHSQVDIWFELITMLENLKEYKVALTANLLAAKKLPRNKIILAKLAYSFATSPDRETRDGMSALKIAEQLYSMQSDYQTARVLSVSYAEADQCDKAVEWMDKAIEMGRASSQTESILLVLQRNRDYFADNKPCRIP
jgi:tetratricopeptide (TPR) repeat protein